LGGADLGAAFFGSTFYFLAGGAFSTDLDLELLFTAALAGLFLPTILSCFS